MNVLCSATPCPTILSTNCVFYYGANLVYTGIATNDNLTTILEKIDTAIGAGGGIGTVTSVNATGSTGISVTGGPITSSGTFIITNTAPDQTVVLTSGTGIGISGTYPSFTITNSLPDQTVVLTAGTGISVTGTYPSFTIATNGVGSVTSIATTSPITGGTITSTGTIGITQSGTLTDGYLSSTDWNTFNNKQSAGNYITALTGEASATGPGSVAITLTNSAVIGKVLTGLNVIGSAIVATDTILEAFGKTQNQINALVGGLNYQGVWNASTNTPTLTSSVGTKGYYYKVSVAGTTNLDGITDWEIGDLAIFNGTVWDQIDNTDSVSSVNGYTGAVSLTTADVPEVTNLYYTDARARNSISLTTTGTSGAATYNSTTGVFNVPQYADASGGSGYIQNQVAVTQTAGFKISGDGTLDNITVGGDIINNASLYASGGYDIVVKNIGTNTYETIPSSSIPIQYWTTGTGTSIIPNGSYGVRITSPIGSGTGVFRSDVQVELYGINAGLSLFNNRTPGAINSDESFIVTGAYDAGGTAGKTSSISAKWYDVTSTAAKGLLRLNVTTISGGTDHIDFRMFGGGGIAVFGPDDSTFPGDGVFKVHGQIVATGTVTMPTPFTLGATSVTTTGTQLNYLNAATGTTGTASTNLVFSTSPVLTTPNIGAATFSTLTGGTASTITFANTSAGSITDAISIRNGGTTAGTGNRINFITGTSTQSARINSVLTSSTVSDLVFSTMTGGTIGEAGRFLGDKTLSLVGSIVITAGNNINILNSVSATTGYQQVHIANTSGDCIFGVEGSTAGTIISGSTAYSVVVGSNAARDLHLIAGAAIKYTISSAGNHDFKSGTAAFGGAVTITSAGSTTYASGNQLKVSSTGSGHRAELHLTDSITSDAFISFFPSATAASRFVEISSNGADGGIKIFGNGALKLDTYGAGTLTTDASGNVTATSDMTLKILDSYYTNGLSAIRGVVPINHYWHKESGLDTKTLYTGFSAQNIQKYIPEAVGKMSNGKLTLQDRPIMATMVNAIKELDTIGGKALQEALIRIEEQEDRIKLLEDKLNILLAKL